MAENKTIEDQVKEIQAKIQALQAQNELLAKQNQVLTSQVTNSVSHQTAQASIDKAVVEKTKELIDAQSSLEKARAKEPFAELLGVKEALSGLTIQGKDGTIAVNKGTDGALLLRAKGEMLEALDSIAQEIVQRLPPDQAQFVIASKADLESAYKSEVLLKRIDTQKTCLEQARERVQPQRDMPGKDTMEAFPAVMAGVESAGLVLGALNDLSKFFRVDRAISIFEGGEEAQQILETLLEAHAAKSNPKKGLTIRLDEPNEDVVTEAMAFLTKLNQLKTSYDQASDLVSTIQKQSDSAKQSAGSPKPDAPAAYQAVTDLKGEIDNVKTLIDSVNPSKNPDAFWAQVAGQVKRKRTKGKARIILSTKAQTAVTLEKRTWRSDRLVGSGEIQVLFRVTDASGNYLASGVLLRTTPTRNAYNDSAGHEKIFPKVLRDT